MKKILLMGNPNIGKAVVINIIDATNLERSLNLTLQLLKKKIPLILALNFWDETKHTGVHIDIEKLKKLLNIPCVPTVAVTGEGIKEMIDMTKEAKVSNYDCFYSFSGWFS